MAAWKHQTSEVACQFVEEQLLSNSPAPSSPSLAVNSYQIILTESELCLLLKLLYQLKIAPLDEYEFRDLDEKERHRQYVEQRWLHLNKLYLAIGEYLFAQGISAAYNFFCKTDATQAEKLRSNLLYKKIMELKDGKPLGIFPEMTLALLQSQYPAEYAASEKHLLDTGLEWLGLPQPSAELAAPQQTTTAKRTGSPLHMRGENKAARLEEKTQSNLPSRAP